jgi:hypothetical protein
MTPRLFSKMGFFGSKKAENNAALISAAQSDPFNENGTPVRLSEDIELSTGGVSQSSNATGDAEEVGRMRVVVRYNNI